MNNIEVKHCIDKISINLTIKILFIKTILAILHLVFANLFNYFYFLRIFYMSEKINIKRLL